MAERMMPSTDRKQVNVPSPYLLFTSSRLVLQVISRLPHAEERLLLRPNRLAENLVDSAATPRSGFDCLTR
jgi:hypothetical protein